MKDEADFMEEVGKLTAYAQQYVKDQVAYGKLEIAERSSLAISWIVILAIVGTFAFIISLLLSLALGLYIGQCMDSYVTGFLVVAGIYFIFGLLLFLLRKPLFVAPITIQLIKKIYERD